MKAYEYILSRQVDWALNHERIDLIGSKGARGRLAYTRQLDQNLFQPLSPANRLSFQEGDGDEVSGNPDNPAKMQALHSSSALSVNVFQYWQAINQLPVIAAACGFCRKGDGNSSSLHFEDKYQIDPAIKKPPNIDVTFHNPDSADFQRFAVECKFSEPYSPHRHTGLKPKYLALSEVWQGLPTLHDFAKSISPVDGRFAYLHAAQLVKHILGLKAKLDKSAFRVLYLWYDALGEEGAAHHREIAAFAEIARSDGVHFHDMTYQQLIVLLSREQRRAHPDYVKYLTERYL